MLLLTDVLLLLNSTKNPCYIGVVGTTDLKLITSSVITGIIARGLYIELTYTTAISYVLRKSDINLLIVTFISLYVTW